MEILQSLIINDSREFTTPGGVFISFIPRLFKGERGSMIVVEKAIIEKIKEGLPVAVKEKTGKKGKYFVIRSAKPGEKKYRIFSIRSGGKQDHRYDYGWFEIKNIINGFLVYDISSGWGSQHEVLIALVAPDGYADIEGNEGSGFKGRNPQPDFFIRLNSDGRQEAIADPDIDIS